MRLLAGPTTRVQQVPNVFNGLPSGTYTVQVVDNLGATITTAAIVTGSYSSMSSTVTSQIATCLDNDGEIFVNTSGERTNY